VRFRGALQRLLQAAGFGTIQYGTPQAFLDIPIIFITAIADEHARTQALAARAYCYLVKPFEEDDLLQNIHRALQRTTQPT
jgi:CheY-like chemotaxis protein